MNKKNIIWIIVGLVIVVGLFTLIGTRDVELEDEEVLTEEVAEQAVSEWIKNYAPTYVYDGFDLELMDVEEIEEERKYALLFEFLSRQAGYGDRTGQALAQVITPHQIEVVLRGEEIVSAITDGVYDELEGEFVDEEAEEEFGLTEREVSLYFVEVVDGQEQIVELLVTIPAGEGQEKVALEKLLEGPTEEEKEELGISTSIPEETELISLEIEDGLAEANFNEKLQEGVAGSAWVVSIREQIERTLRQFETVDNVLILVEGESEDVLQP